MDVNLGQVFTKKVVANYMVSLFSPNKNAKYLDPCFGDGVFLAAFAELGKTDVTGYELDENLYDLTREQYPGYNLMNSDFLQAPSNKKYDGIIMNPPYIRHEKINDLTPLGIEKSVLAKNPLYENLPATANMYMYFTLKAVSLLKENGELVVIFPSSWLQAKSGDGFRAALYEQCGVERQIHISGEIFDETAIVDVLILKLKKGDGNRFVEPEYVKLKFDGKGILFGYFIRDDMKFVHNDSVDTVGGNFYVIHPTIDIWLCFALLNNLYTYCQLERMGKKYGGGLLKIQRYDIENPTFPDTQAFSDDDLSRMAALAENLAMTGNRETIDKITAIISNYVGIPYETVSHTHSEDETRPTNPNQTYVNLYE